MNTFIFGPEINTKPLIRLPP